MHQYAVNASLQIIPVVQDRHAYEWIDEAISIIQKSGVKYEAALFATTLDGTYDDVIKVVHDVNEYLLRIGCAKRIANVQIQIRGNGDITGDEKTGKFK